MKTSFLRKISLNFARILIRFYDQLLVGIFSILLIIPLDYYLSILIEGESEYLISSDYFFYFFIYGIFFVISSALLPYFKNLRVENEIDRLIKNNLLSYYQVKKIQKILKDVLTGRNLWTPEGILQFSMTLLFALGVAIGYFAAEGVVLKMMHHGIKNIYIFKIPILYTIIFLLLLSLESFLDGYLAKKMKKKYKLDLVGSHNKNKELLSLILMNAGGGSSLSQQLGQVLIEDTIKDVCEILEVSEDRHKISKKNFARNKKNLKLINIKKGQRESFKFQKPVKKIRPKN